MLKELAGAFGVAGAGVGAPVNGTLQVQQHVRVEDSRGGHGPPPWVVFPPLITELRSKPDTATQTNGAGQSFLIVPFAWNGADGVLWLEAEDTRSWTEEESSALRLVSHVLGQKKSFSGQDQSLIQQRLQDAGSVSGKIAHAFDNILTGIMGFAELTLSQSDPKSFGHQYIAEVVQAAQLGVQVTQQLHMLSRCAVPTPGPADLVMAISEEEARQSSAESGATLRVELAPDLPSVAIDSDPLRQVLAQLVDNAREAAGPGGTVSVTAQRSNLDDAALVGLLGTAPAGPCVEIVIQDSGPGFTEEAWRRVPSEPFFTTKPKHRGLGLAVVYRILAAHHAGFRLESGPNRPTVVRVFLPLALQSAKSPSARPPLGRPDFSHRRYSS